MQEPWQLEHEFIIHPLNEHNAIETYLDAETAVFQKFRPIFSIKHNITAAYHGCLRVLCMAQYINILKPLEHHHLPISPNSLYLISLLARTSSSADNVASYYITILLASFYENRVLSTTRSWNLFCSTTIYYPIAERQAPIDAIELAWAFHERDRLAVYLGVSFARRAPGNILFPCLARRGSRTT